MVDGESHGNVSEPAGGAPINRDKRPNDVMIEGEAAPAESERSAPEPETEKIAEEPALERAPPPEPTAPPPPSMKPPGVGRALAAGALSGAVVSALAAAAGYYLLPLKANLSEADVSRLPELPKLLLEDIGSV